MEDKYTLNTIPEDPWKKDTIIKVQVSTFYPKH